MSEADFDVIVVGAGCAGNGTEQLMAVGGGVRHENVADAFAGHTQRF